MHSLVDISESESTLTLLEIVLLLEFCGPNVSSGAKSVEVRFGVLQFLGSRKCFKKEYSEGFVLEKKSLVALVFNGFEIC